MAEDTISWCHYTHNIWEGCHKVSPGCKFCYAEAMNRWLRKGENWGLSAPRRTFSPEHYKKPIAWNAKAEREGTRFRVFVNSISDIGEIHPDPAVNTMLDILRGELYTTILATPYLDWLFLTKRPENYERILPWGGPAPIKNLWLGTTVEDMEHAARRYNTLMSVPAAKHFFSYEPALGPIDWPTLFDAYGRVPDLIIFGDESGRKRRDAQIAWARHTRDACLKYGVLWHFKQWCGADADGLAGERSGKRIIHLPILDGVQHANFPKETT